MGVLFTFITRKNAEPQALANMLPAPVAYILSILESVTVGILVALIIPMGKLGRGLGGPPAGGPPMGSNPDGPPMNGGRPEN